MILNILLYVVAGHSVLYWLTRAWQATAPLVRLVWRMRHPRPYYGVGDLHPDSMAAFTRTLAGVTQTDLSKFTTDDEHQMHWTIPTTPDTPVDSGDQPARTPAVG